MNKPKSRKPQKPSSEQEAKKHAEPLKVDMPFDEFVSRIIRVKPPEKK